MLSGDSGQGSEEMLCTPRRAQKRLFTIHGSSSKRKLFQQVNPRNEDDTTSGDESDLGPMSPLALTDRSPSSTYSSPGRQFVSPLATPESSPQIPLMKITWDRLKPISGHSDKRLSPFSSLKHITRNARSSPRRKIFPASPKSCVTPSKRIIDQSPISRYSDEFIPETPLRDENMRDNNENQVAETPEKENSPVQKMITPLGSVNKDVSLPRLHRRKSLGAFDVDEISPEKKGTSVKRHMNDPIILGTKLQKVDESCSIPKARAALFQDKEENQKITVDTKSFYGTTKRLSLNAFAIDWKKFDQSRKRRSLPVQRVIPKSNPRQSQKKHKKGEINCGVSHGIKKPKPKKHISRVEAFKQKQASPPSQLPENKTQSDTLISQSSSQILQNNTNKKPEREPSPEIDPTKRFFKSVRSKPATVTVNKKIKLNVSDGKITLNPKNLIKKPKLNISLDATDLTVDEPEIESSKNKAVENLLKILEDDWTDDEYEPIDTSKNVTNSPGKYPCFQDAMMSPASELSNMTSSMNIEDTTMQIDDKINSQKEGNNTVRNLYPLFTKGYSSNREEVIPKNRGVKRSANGQLLKAGAAENQYQLDCGQKKFGATQCNECGIVYQIGDPQDENAHLNFHNSVKTLKFHGWKNERVMWEEAHTASRIIMVEPNDSKQYWKKVTEILNVVDTDLGLADMELSYYRDKKVYLYIRDKNILGVLVVEPVKEAHRMIPELMELDCCSSDSTPAKCGINVVWTAMSHRRQGIAKQLVDTLRRNYYYGYIMTKDDLAFSTPTPSGKLFAEKYTNTRNFKVYS